MESNNNAKVETIKEIYNIDITKYKRAKIINSSNYIWLITTINSSQFRFSTRLPITKENMDFVENNYIETIEKYNKVTGSEGTPISKLANQLKKVLAEQPEKANNRNGYARVVREGKQQV